MNQPLSNLGPNRTPSVNRFAMQQAGLRFSGKDPEKPKDAAQPPADQPPVDQAPVTQDGVTGPSEDVVEIKGAKPAEPFKEPKDGAQAAAETPDKGKPTTGATDDASNVEDKSDKKDPASTAAKQEEAPSNFSLRFKEAKGLFFWKVVPLLFSVSFFGGPLGFAIGIAGIPLSYLSGKYGRNVLKDIKPEQMSNMAKLAEMLEHPEKIQDGQIVDQLNLVAKDTLNGVPILRHAPKVVTFLATLPKRLPWLLSLFPNLATKLQKIPGMAWKFNKDKGIGKLLNNRVMLRANILTRVANSDSVGEAAINGTKGAANYFFWMKMVAPLGKMIGRFANVLPGFMRWPVKAAGMAVENAALIKMGFDIAKSGNESKQSNPPTKENEPEKTP